MSERDRNGILEEPFVTRVEVVDDSGRVLTRYPKSVKLSYQDDGRTLKVFLSGEHPTARDEHRRGLGKDIAELRKRILG